ncbi:MAG: pilus assembly PilX N-terminal domain-containing protein [Betaproteobacteria bacterium]
MDLRREDGIAVIIALMAMMLMTALGIALVLTTTSETRIAANYRNSSEGLYAADAALERAMDDVLTVPDWNRLLDGSTQSAFIDGAPSGTRTLPDGTTLDLTQVVNMANCDKLDACSDADMNAITADREWGANNPRWQLYAYAPINNILPTGTVNSPYYVVVLVGDDPSENDGDPAHDGVVECGSGQTGADGSCNPGSGVLALRAEAFGPSGSMKVVEMTVARTDTTELERGYTGQRGQDEQNRRARKAAVQTPGKSLTMQSLSVATGGIK